jgi:hypothetical protein
VGSNPTSSAKVEGVMPKWTIGVDTVSGFKYTIETMAETDLGALETALVLIRNDPDLPRDAIRAIFVSEPH